MFALGAQQTGQAVSLLLRPATRKDFMQVAIIAFCRPPLLSEMPDHLAHLCLHTVPLEDGDVMITELDDDEQIDQRAGKQYGWHG